MNVRKLMARLCPPIKPIPAGVEKGRHRGHSASMRAALEGAGRYRTFGRDGDGRPVAAELTGMPSPARIEGVSPTRSGYNPDAITGIDIAHALGLVRDEMARELFCHLWWPDGAARSRPQLEQAIHVAMMTEMARRDRAAAAAKLDCHLIEENVERWRGEHREALRRARSDRDRAIERRWPGTLSGYAAITLGVLDELAEPSHCVTCEGRGEVMLGALATQCGSCEGTGTIGASDRERAERIDRALSTYQAGWRKPYEWLWRHCWRKEGHAASIMRKALAPDIARAA
jgi:hypothetical protein